MRRQTIIALGAALFLTAPLVAQDPPTAARRPAHVTLSDSQRAQLRAIHDKYRPEFTKHHEEMTALRQKMQAEVEQALPAGMRERFAARGERGMGRNRMAMRGMQMQGMGMPGRHMRGMGMQRMGGRPMAGGMGRMGMPGMVGHPMTPGMGGRGMPGGPAWGQGGAMTGVRARIGAPAMRADSVQVKRPAKVAAPAAAKAKPGPV